MYLLSCLPISPHPIPVVLTGGWKGGGNRWNFWRQIVARSVTARLLYLITGKYGNSWSMTFTFRQFTTRNMEMGAGCLRNLVFVFSHNPFCNFFGILKFKNMQWRAAAVYAVMTWNFAIFSSRSVKKNENLPPNHDFFSSVVLLLQFESKYFHFGFGICGSNEWGGWSIRRALANQWYGFTTVSLDNKLVRGPNSKSMTFFQSLRSLIGKQPF